MGRLKIRRGERLLDREIIKLFNTTNSKILYFSDIAEKLNAGLEEVVNACKRLIKKGKIFVKD